MKAFVTGGTGFIGSHLVEELLRRGYTEVRCLVRRDPKWLSGLPVTLVRGDLADEAALREGVRGVDMVYHVAGVTRAEDEATFEEGNVVATLRLLDAVEAAAPDVRRVLVTSSLAAVGPCPVGVASEDAPLRPVSRYGASKARMERRLSEYRADGTNHFDRLPLVVVRPPSVYGPREADIYTLFQSAARGVFPVTGDPDVPYLSLVHGRDLVRGMADAAEAETTVGETYFIGSERAYSWNEVKAAMTNALGRRALTVPVPERLVTALGAAAEFGGRLVGVYPAFNREKAREARETCKICTVAKAARDFGYRETIPLLEGMRETVTWYRAVGWL